MTKVKLTQEELIAKLDYEKSVTAALSQSLGNLFQTIARKNIDPRTDPVYALREAEYQDRVKAVEELQEQLRKQIEAEKEARVAPYLQEAQKSVDAATELLKGFKDIEYHAFPRFFEELKQTLDSGAGGVNKLRQENSNTKLTDRWFELRGWMRENRSKIVDPTRLLRRAQ